MVPCIFILYLSYLTGLDHLCEFIEDCEHTTLAVRIIHLLGREGPRTRHPARYIRFVYNRVILEVHTPLNSCLCNMRRNFTKYLVTVVSI